MKIAVLYNLVETPTDGTPLPIGWRDIITRFVASYKSHDSGASHDLYICSSGAELSLSSKTLLCGLKYKSITYKGGGWDVGAYQYCAKRLRDYDLIVCLNSQAFIVQNGWLKCFADAYEEYGPGIYGASSSFEVAPHIRTSSFGVSPKLFLSYPLRIRSRYDACVFEHSPTNFSLWARSKNIPVYVVMRSGVYPLLESRRGENIFRRGTQEDLLINDRHTLIYDRSLGEERERLERLADGKGSTEFIYLSKVGRALARYKPLRTIRALFRT